MVYQKILIIAAVAALGAAAPQTSLKAASTYVNCGCQCDSFTFRDHYGKIQGNCKSSDHRGQWCYVSQHSSCDDRYFSTKFKEYGNYRRYSYEACSTPSLNSYQCRNNNHGGGYNSGFGNNHNSGYTSGFGNNNNNGYGNRGNNRRNNRRRNRNRNRNNQNQNVGNIVDLLQNSGLYRDNADGGDSSSGSSSGAVQFGAQ